MKQIIFSRIFLSPSSTANAFSSSKGVINWNKWCDAAHSGELEMTWQLCDRQKKRTRISDTRSQGGIESYLMLSQNGWCLFCTPHEVKGIGYSTWA